MFTLAAASGLIAYILTGPPEEQDHRAQVIGTVLATLLVVPTAIAAAWRWAAEHRHREALNDTPAPWNIPSRN